MNSQIKILAMYHTVPIGYIIALGSVCILLGMLLSKLRRTRVFVQDFYVHQPPKKFHATAQTVFDRTICRMPISNESRAFLGGALMRSGLGDDTAVPNSFFTCQFNEESANEEMEAYLSGAMDGLLARTGMKPSDIDILVVNCSCYCPTPSMTAWIVNRYNMPSSTRTFHLGGMGCSASMIGVDLVKDLLKANPGKRAVLISTEMLTYHMYMGENPSFSLQSALFRSGAAAVLFTTRRIRSTRYELLRTVRTHHGRKEDSFNCISLEDDGTGHVGVRLSRDIPAVAGRAIEENMTRIGEMMLPLSEKARFLWASAVRPLLGMKAAVYRPDFSKCIDNFCIHTGGRAVIDTVEKNLGLTAEQIEASRATLYQYGNTSSSSVWYELAYLEQHKLVCPGNTVWQLAFGSGFKVNSCLLRALPGCSTDPVDFNVHNNSWRFSKETCPLPTIKFPPAVEAARLARQARKAREGIPAM
ncbi:Very-long-chain 3-ketoacyl-CoA synthase [Carpediemonas membranifera]|uniref:3-ketoacyl-CoA synthase n=1 Tax=Carpediemonas membranifera TaxID=201153 RepID=A0A8J6AR45_9EUKA|nr:Very-long-chain 3-ketoacyl-CoA synthase [Carpediemonas membranifera]|eukprot:KAG9390020.1 Very-long-chain 3-ketoacyl-CoA synthase [Carpediemonas membranifera]